MPLAEAKFGIFLEKPNIVFNIFGEKAKIKVSNFVMFLGIAIILLSSLIKEFMVPVATLGIVICLFSVVVLGYKNPNWK